MTLPGHPSNPEDPNDDEQMFDYISVEPNAWNGSALGLWVSARWIRERHAALHEHPGSNDLPYRPQPEELMLRGMAVECQLKAVLFMRRHLEGAFTVEDRARLGSWFRQHILARIATKAGIDPSGKEIRVLGMLAAFVMWAGRYPTSMKPSDWDYPRWRVPEDDDVFDALWDRIEEITTGGEDAGGDNDQDDPGGQGDTDPTTDPRPT